MTSPDIRRLTPDEWRAFRDVRLEALRTEPANFASDYGATKTRTAAQWRATLSDLAIYGAFDGDALIGNTGLIAEAAPKMAHRASVVMVYVRPAHRRRGVAARLLRAVCAHALDAGVWQIKLTVSAENDAAHRAYLRDGFTEYGRLPAGYIHEGRAIDDILMMRRLRRTG